MLDRIISFCLCQRLFIAIVVVVIVIAGAFSMRALPLDAFPDVSNIQVEVLSQAPGLSPLEVERFVTYPIELGMRGLPKLTQLRSTSRYGLSVVTVVFSDDTDIYFARQQVFERLAEVRDRLPPGVETVTGPVATAMGEIYQYTLEGKNPGMDEKHYLADLRTLQEWVVTPILKSVPGISEVNSFGGYVKQYQALVDPEKLIKYDLSLREVYEALEKSTLNAGGGFLERFSQQHIIRGIGLAEGVKDLEKVVLKSSEGTPVLLKDVAAVRLGQAARQGAALKNGEREVVGGVVMMLRGSNSNEVIRQVKKKVDEINRSGVLPWGVKLKAYYDRTDIVNKATGTLIKTLIEGVLFVTVILYLFLRSLRGAGVVIAALFLTVLCSFILLKSTGMTANLMSLGGLIISLGMIIDSAIIQTENVQRHLSEAAPEDNKLGTVLRAVLEVRKPSILGELIIALTFLPILALQGYEGKMFSSLAITVFFALLSSLALSIFVIPTVCFKLLRHHGEKESFLAGISKKLYLPLLRKALRHRPAVLALALAVFIGGLAFIPFLGTEFMPVMDEGAFDMDTMLLPGIALPNALEINKRVQKALKQFPELEIVVGKTGQSELALEARGVDSTMMTGIFRPKDEWKDSRSTGDLIDRMRKALEDIPGIVISFSQPIQCRIDELVAGTKSQIVIKLFGEDMEVLKKNADAIGKVLSSVRGVKDLVVERISGQPYITITIDRNSIARVGLTMEAVQDVIRTGLAGRTSGKVYEGDKSFDIVLRVEESRRNSVEAIGNLLVDLPAKGSRVPLKQLADIRELEGPLSIGREYGNRRLLIQCNVKDRDIGGFVAESQRRIREKVKLPAGYYLTWGGQFENQQRAMKTLALIVPVTVVLIFFLLFSTFNSLRLAALVMLNLPFALTGGIAALFISGLYLSVPGSVGFIALFGVAVLNGVVLVSYLSQLEESGLPLQEAILIGCERRLSPVLMTATITVLSLIPLLLASGPGSEVQRPLAVVVVGGLITSTALTLFILPLLYSMFRQKDATRPAGGANYSGHGRSTCP